VIFYPSFAQTTLYFRWPHFAFGIQTCASSKVTGGCYNSRSRCSTRLPKRPKRNQIKFSSASTGRASSGAIMERRASRRTRNGTFRHSRNTSYTSRLNKFGKENTRRTDLPVQVAKRQITSRAVRFLGNLQAEEENGDYWLSSPSQSRDESREG